MGEGTNNTNTPFNPDAQKPVSIIDRLKGAFSRDTNHSNTAAAEAERRNVAHLEQTAALNQDQAEMRLAGINQVPAEQTQLPNTEHSIRLNPTVTGDLPQGVQTARARYEANQSLNNIQPRVETSIPSPAVEEPVDQNEQRIKDLMDRGMSRDQAEMRLARENMPVNINMAPIPQAPQTEQITAVDTQIDQLQQRVASRNLSADSQSDQPVDPDVLVDERPDVPLKIVSKEDIQKATEASVIIDLVTKAKDSGRLEESTTPIPELPFRKMKGELFTAEGSRDLRIHDASETAPEKRNRVSTPDGRVGIMQEIWIINNTLNTATRYSLGENNKWYTESNIPLIDQDGKKKKWGVKQSVEADTELVDLLKFQLGQLSNTKVSTPAAA